MFQIYAFDQNHPHCLRKWINLTGTVHLLNSQRTLISFQNCFISHLNPEKSVFCQTMNMSFLEEWFIHNDIQRHFLKLISLKKDAFDDESIIF
jgi:hypothetical protein